MDDTLICDLSNLYQAASELKPTKQNVIGLSARVYDPLGFLSPLTVCFKLLFQDICVAKLNWDDDLEGDLLKRWKGLILQMREPLLLRIPRCYFKGMGEPLSCSLVGFCDASARAYAVVVYMNIVSSEGCVTRFVASKTRVAPLSAQTIPRLELLAALLLARLLSSVASALGPEHPLGEPLCFTDSKIALCWIRGFDKEWKQFVENRVREIHSLVAEKCWYHCAGNVNPADLPSRGADLSELGTCIPESWLTLPPGLCEPEHETSEIGSCSSEASAMELKIGSRPTSQNTHSLVVQELCQFDSVIRCEDFSTLRRLFRVTAYVQKFVATRVDLNRRMRYLSLVMVTFWKKWRSEYLTALREHHAYDPGLGKPPSKVAVGDVVLIFDPGRPRTIWRMGKVETLLEGADGAARGASL